MPFLTAIYLVVAMEIIAFGPAFLVVAFIMYVLSATIGAWTACQIRELDDAINANISKIKGRKQKSSVNDYCMLVQNSAKYGVVCPIIPVIMLVVGVYCTYLAEKHRNKDVRPYKQIDATTSELPLHPAFSAPGRVEFR